MLALMMRHNATVKALTAGGAKMMASGTYTNWPSSVTWNPSSAEGSKDAKAAALSQDKIAQCQAMCASPYAT